MLPKQVMNPENQLRYYEQVLVLHASSTEEEQKNICLTHVDLIEKEKGKFFCLDTWGSRPIANPLAKKVSRGLYFYMLFSSPPHVLSEIRKELSLNKKVLYFHQEKLAKKEKPESYLKKFFQHLEQTKQKEKERLAKIQKKQNFSSRN